MVAKCPRQYEVENSGLLSNTRTFVELRIADTCALSIATADR